MTIGTYISIITLNVNGLNASTKRHRLAAAAAAAKSLQLCPTLCDPMDCSLPGFSVQGILQARTLEWVAKYTYITYIPSLLSLPPTHSPPPIPPI